MLRTGSAPSCAAPGRLEAPAEAPDPFRPELRRLVPVLPRPGPGQENGAFPGFADVKGTGMEFLEARAVTDRQDACALQLVLEQAQHGGLVLLVEGGGCLIH